MKNFICLAILTLSTSVLATPRLGHLVNKISAPKNKCMKGTVEITNHLGARPINVNLKMVRSRLLNKWLVSVTVSKEYGEKYLTKRTPVKANITVCKGQRFVTRHIIGMANTFQFVINKGVKFNVRARQGYWEAGTNGNKEFEIRGSYPLNNSAISMLSKLAALSSTTISPINPTISAGKDAGKKFAKLLKSYQKDYSGDKSWNALSVIAIDDLPFVQ